MAKAQTLPHRLEVVIDFVNTRDLEEGTDELSTAEGLTGWLAARNLIEPPAAASDGDRRRAVRLREALRGLMIENNGGPGSEGWQELERAAREGELGVHFDPGGTLALAPDPSGACSCRSRRPSPTRRGSASRPAVPPTATGRSMTARATARGCGARWPYAAIGRRSAPIGSARPATLVDRRQHERRDETRRPGV